MGKLSAFISLSLDGVMQAPGGVEEDPRGDFQHGGWARPYSDEVMGAVAAEGMAGTGALLFGRLTYEAFHSYWPQQTDNNPFTEVLNKMQKFVASTTLTSPLPWVNSTLLAGDVPQAVTDLKNSSVDVVILGSGALVQSLMPHQIIDEYILLIHPVVLGSGSRLFIEGSPMTALELTDTKTSSTGVIIATYRA